MKTRLLYFLSFLALAATGAVVIDHIGTPSISRLLVGAVVLAAVTGAPGLVRRRAWPVALLLLPAGAFLFLRLQVPLPTHVHGLGQQVAFYAQQVRVGARLYARDGFPLDFSLGGIRLVVSFSVYLALWLAAFLALSLRKALPAIVIVLVLLGFGFTTDDTPRVLWAPLAFLLLSGCLLAFSRSLERERGRAADAVAGAVTALLAALLAFSLLGATSVAAGQPWQDWRTWEILSASGAHLGFDWMENYPNLLDPRNDAPVMRVTSPVATYWRANALEEFDGDTWFSGASYSAPLTPEPVGGSYHYALPQAPPRPADRLVTESFAVDATYTDYLFAGGDATTVDLDSRAPLRTNSVGALVLDEPLGPRFAYSITAVVPQLKPTDVVDRGRAYPLDVVQHDTALPFPALAELQGPDKEADWQRRLTTDPVYAEWLGLYRLDQTVVGDSTDPYRIALNIEQYLRTHYTYSLDVPITPGRSPYAEFLFHTRTGYCQHFAGAMAVLLRYNGIPARVDVGFTSGFRAKDGVFHVSRNDAHAWVEAYFPGAGWVTFDPTPGHVIPVPGPSSASVGFVDPFVKRAAGAVAGAAGAAGAARRDPRSRGDRGGAGSGAAAPPRRTVWVPVLAALAAAVVLWPAARALVRRRRLRTGSYEERLARSLGLLFAELRDYGVVVPRSATLDETAAYLRDELGVDAGPLFARVQAVFFGGRAASADDLAALAACRRELRRRMRNRKGRVRAVLALYGLPAPSAARI